MTVLYHYCSTDAFSSIVTSRSIRLSSLTLSNDSNEGATILDVLLKHAQDSGLDRYAQSRLERELRRAYDFFDGSGFCLSENGDLLSQWRGYADDGRAVSIGFRSEYFEALAASRRSKEQRSFHLKKLIYDGEAQKATAAEHFEELCGLLENGAFRDPSGSLLAPSSPEQQTAIKQATHKAVYVVLATMLRMFEIKNPAFSEEQEWRLVSMKPKGSHDRDEKFRPSRDKIIPFFEVALDELEIQPIEVVMLGPKHQTPIQVIDTLLRTRGFDSFSVAASVATYR